jgi:hypothetical protein
MVKNVCNYKQAYTQYGGLRPFGVAFLFAGWDKHYGFQLYQSDPSGNYSGWKATVIGKSAGSFFFGLNNKKVVKFNTFGLLFIFSTSFLPHAHILHSQYSPSDETLMATYLRYYLYLQARTISLARAS